MFFKVTTIEREVSHSQIGILLTSLLQAFNVLLIPKRRLHAQPRHCCFPMATCSETGPTSGNEPWRTEHCTSEMTTWYTSLLSSGFTCTICQTKSSLQRAHILSALNVFLSLDTLTLLSKISRYPTTGVYPFCPTLPACQREMS